MVLALLEKISVRNFARTVLCLAVIGLSACDTPEEKVQAHYESGLELLEDKNYVKAGLEFRNALQINGTFVPALYSLTVVEEQLGNWEKVGGLLSKVLDLDAKHVAANYRFGRLMLLGGRLDKALEFSDTAMNLDANDPGSLALRAAVLYKLEDKPGAVKAALAALELEPGNVDAISVMAAERIAAGEVLEAVEYLDKGIAENEANIALRVIKADSLGSVEEFDKVEQTLQELIALKPENRQFRISYARFLTAQGRLDDAEKTFRSFAESAPDNLEAQLDVVRFLNSFRSSEAGEAQLLRLVNETEGDSFPYKQALTRLYFSSGRPDDAKQILQGVIEKGSEENRLLAKNQLADILVSQNDAEGAKALNKEVLAADPRNVEALSMRASFSLLAKESDPAIADLRTVLKEKPDSVRAMLLLSQAHELNGDRELADDRITGAFQVSNGDPVVALSYARFLIRGNKLGRAEDALLKALGRSPRNIALFRALAQVRISQRDFVGAQEIAESLKELGDNESVVGEIMGLALEGQEKSAQSLSAFEEAQAATPDDIRPIVALVRAYMRNEEFDKAEEFLQAVLETSKNNYYAHIMMGELYALTDRSEEAVKQFRTAITTSPDRYNAYNSLAKFMIGQGKIDRANEIVEEGLRNVPDNVILGLVRGNLQERASDFESALAEYKRLYEINPNSPVVINNYVSMLTERTSDEEILKKAYELAKSFRHSNVPQFKDTLGWIQYKRGEISDAAKLLGEAAEKLPNLALVRYHLGMAYLAGDRKSSAIREFEAALETSKDNPIAETEEIVGLLKRLRPGEGGAAEDAAAPATPGILE